MLLWLELNHRRGRYGGPTGVHLNAKFQRSRVACGHCINYVDSSSSLRLSRRNRTMSFFVRSKWWMIVSLAAFAIQTVVAQGADEPDVIRDADGFPVPHAVLRLGTAAWRHPSRCWGLEWSPDGKTITLNCGIYGIRTLDAVTGRQIRRVPLPPTREDAIAISPDGKELACRRLPDGVMTVDAVTGNELAHYPDLRGWFALQYSPSGKYLVGAAAADVYEFDLVDRKTDEVILTAKTAGRPSGFAFSSDETQLYVASANVAQWDIAKKKENRAGVRRRSDQSAGGLPRWKLDCRRPAWGGCLPARSGQGPFSP
jgi:WD40 repeat protein